MILKSEDDQSTLHVYIKRHHNETHQTLFKKRGMREWEMGI
jgi:hypothetical protein